MIAWRDLAALSAPILGMERHPQKSTTSDEPVRDPPPQLLHSAESITVAIPVFMDLAVSDLSESMESLRKNYWRTRSRL